MLLFAEPAMTDIKPCEAWAVVGPDGYVYAGSCATTEADAVSRYIRDLNCTMTKKSMQRWGYTVQPVTIIGRKG